MIDKFTDEYFFLSNFFESKVTYEGITYLNNEAAFQAMKTLDENERKAFAELDPDAAKKAGRKISLRSDWEDVKTELMYEICKAKFTQNNDLAEKLLATGDEELVEGNNWNDKIWGKVNGEGENRLGVILMRIREELRK
ncbi:MAG: NADAR family protein [Ruminococcus sp.]|uniref:NADAR family protein n=1 Tax=Ruminococcus sp. TaxID=41978 RepID=UPI0025FCA0DB|nr:NADAR family protein [Ruminococcus sp.]MCR5541099.1 NADAR family protein [Ruminococcus sp.]